MKATYAIFFYDKMMDQEIFKGGSCEGKFMSDIERKVRQAAVKELKELHFQADMEDRYEIKSYKVEIEF